MKIDQGLQDRGGAMEQKPGHVVTKCRLSKDIICSSCEQPDHNTES